MRVPKFTLGSTALLRPPCGKNIIPARCTLPYLDVCKFQLSSYNSFRDKIWDLPHLHPATLVVEKLSFPKSAVDTIWMCVTFQLSSSNSFRDVRCIHIYTRGRCALLMSVTEKNFKPEKSTWPNRNVCKISTL